MKFNLTNFPDASQKELTVYYDNEAISGIFFITNQGNTISFNVSGHVDSLIGQFSAPLSTTATQKINTGKLSGSVTAEYSGSITGQIDITGKANGYLQLDQKITAIEGNIPQLKVGDTQQIKAEFTGLAAPR